VRSHDLEVCFKIQTKDGYKNNGEPHYFYFPEVSHYFHIDGTYHQGLVSLALIIITHGYDEGNEMRCNLIYFNILLSKRDYRS
jgi:hypothetical protein